MLEFKNSLYSNKGVEQEDYVDREDLVSKQHISLAIGRQIHIIRKMYGITGKQLGELLNVSQQQVSRYERGRCHLDIYTLVKLLHILDISIDHFFTDVSLRLKESSPAIYKKYHALFFPVVNVSNNDYVLMKTVGKFI